MTSIPSSPSLFWLSSRITAIALVLGTVAFIPEPSLAFALPKLPFFAITGCFGLWAIHLHPQRSSLSVLSTTWIGRFLLASIVLILVSPLLSIAPLLSVVGAPPRFMGMLTYAVASSMLVIGIVFVHDERTRRFLTSALVSAGGIIAFYGLLQMVHLDPLTRTWQSELFLGRVFSMIGQPNALGQVLLLLMPFTVLAIGNAARIRRAMLIIVFLVEIMVLLGTASRGAMIGLAVSSIAAFISMPRTAFRAPFRHPMTFFIILGMVGIAALSLLQRFQVPTQNFLGLGARWVLWKAGLLMILERPWGYGLETIGLASPRFLSSEFFAYESLTTKVDRLHSLPLDLLATIGPVATFAFSGFLLLLLLRLWKQRKRHPFVLASFCSLTGTTAALMVGFMDLPTLMLSWLIAGMALGATSDKVSAPEKPSNVFILHLLSSLAVITFIVSLLWMNTRYQWKSTEALLHHGQFMQAAIAAQHATLPFDRQLLIESAETGLLALEQTTDVQAKQILQTWIADTLDQLDTLTNGQDGMVPTMRAWLEATRGNAKTVLDLQNEAIRLRPTDITVFRILAHAYELLEDREHEQLMIEGLRALLPPEWNDETSPRGRILRKEHPWIEPLLERSP